MWQKHCVSALGRKRDRREQHCARYEDCSERFGFAVTVGMGRIRRTRRKTQTSPNDN